MLMNSDSSSFKLTSVAEIRYTLKKFAKSYLHESLRNQINSSDLVQQALLETIINLSELIGKPKKVVKSWMITVMRNHAGKTARRLEVEKKHQFLFINEIATTDESELINIFIRQELIEFIQKYSDSLQSKYRKIFIMYYFDRLELDQITHKTGLSKASVRSILYRLNLDLKNKLIKKMK